MEYHFPAQDDQHVARYIQYILDNLKNGDQA